jgi:hypothetical protein
LLSRYNDNCDTNSERTFMAIPPGTLLKPVTKLDLEQKFDEVWDDTLKNLTPRAYVTPANKALGYPKGAVTITCIFEDAHGIRLADTYRHTTSKGALLGDRQHNPTGLLVDGEWWYI